MRRLDVDRARDGLGGLVGTQTFNRGDPVPYEPAKTFTTHAELSPEEVRQLRDLWHFAKEGDGKQLFPLVTVPREIFEKLAAVWVIE